MEKLTPFDKLLR